MNADKAWILDRSTPELRETLMRVPGAYFQVARETVDDRDDRTAVLDRMLDLYRQSAEVLQARLAASDARLAERRRAHLRIVPSDTPRTMEAP